MKTWYDLSDKDFLKSFFGTLIIVFFFLFVFLYRNYEDKELKKHGVWTVLRITQRFGDGAHYVFQLNDQTYEGYVELNKEKTKSGNRFFVLADPNKISRHRIKNAAPDWLEAPPEGWKKRPTRKELDEMLHENKKKRISEENTAIVEKKEMDDSVQNKKIANLVTLIIICCIIFCILLYLVILYRKKKNRYITEYGVWTIMTIQNKEKDSDYGYQVDFTFKLNRQTYTDTTNMTRKKLKSGRNSFFMIVIPHDVNSFKIYDAVPDWFTENAPPEGWEKCPVETTFRK